MDLKSLRKAAGYKNEGRTPNPKMSFPGIARMYTHPVVSRREAVRTTYVKLPLDLKPTKVRTKVRSLVVDRWGKGITEVEQKTRMRAVLNADGTPKLKPNGQPEMEPVLRKDGTLVTYYGIKEQLVPVTRPARLDPKSPKGIYRALKKLARQGVLVQMGTAALTAEQAGGNA